MLATLIVLVVAGLSFGTGTICPTLVRREQWGAREPLSCHPLVTTPTPWTVVHHAASKGCTNQASCSALVRSFQDLHMDSNHWDDIGYSFLVGEDGNVYEGRGWDLTGAHAPPFNNRSIGICVIGTFSDHLPNTAALSTLQSLIDCGVELGKIRPDYRLIGHRQAKETECPGNKFYDLIQTWSHWINDTDRPR